LISVGHRPELESFHSRKLVLERRSGTTSLVSDIELVPYKSRGGLRRWLRRLVCLPGDSDLDGFARSAMPV
jgi:vitamin B12/bleomycin/antimicrobial peptide transport system ATP-binding/permease protein